jgi:hypothetical protein
VQLSGATDVVPSRRRRAQMTHLLEHPKASLWMRHPKDGSLSGTLESIPSGPPPPRSPCLPSRRSASPPNPRRRTADVAAVGPTLTLQPTPPAPAGLPNHESNRSGSRGDPDR